MSNTKKPLIKLLSSIKSSHKQLSPNPKSLLFMNRLTKSYFSLHDTSLSNRIAKNVHKDERNVEGAVQVRNANSKFLDRYYSHKQKEEDISKDYHNITQAFIPKINLKKSSNLNSQQDLKRTKSVTLSRNSTNKFKLLFREVNTRKTVSQRKIQRLDRKILDISNHNKYLNSLVPAKQEKVEEQKAKPKEVKLNLERITKMVRILIRNISLYFNMYQHPKKVGDVFKSVDGYNKFFHHMLFQNDMDAKQIKNQQQLTKYFWVSQPEANRPDLYGEQDEYLFKILQNYSLKMERSYSQIRLNFVSRQKNNLQKLKKQITKKLSINQKKLDGNITKQNEDMMKEIAEFVDNRKRHNQDRREATMAKLQSYGVKFNVVQRSKEMVLTEKQKIMKNIATIKKSNNGH